MDKAACKALAESFTKACQEKLKKYDVLRELDLFVLDNSIRESTVGQLKGHTIEDKWKIYNASKECGYKNIIVASFNQMTRVDDVFMKDLLAKGEDPETLWAFSEITESIKGKVPDTEKLPVGLRKMQSAGMRNVIFEIDLGDSTYDFDKFTVDQLCDYLEKLIRWCFDNLNKEAKILFNLRDLPDAMSGDADRVFRVVSFLSNLPEDIQLFGIVFEEPRGKSLPEECGTWARYIRMVMDDANWKKGHLLVHVHQKFGYLDATALEVLMNGADGIWASVCSEGAAMGSASSCVTLINLIRLGNKKVLKRYNCSYLRKAAILVTEISTGKPPHKNQPVYGARALDFVFDLGKEEFDLASFFGETAPVRITTLASPEMIRLRLVNLFGENESFTVEQTYEMKGVMLADLRNGRKEEYMSKVGLAILFDRSGGKVTAAMRDAIALDETSTPHAQNLLKEIRERWNEWDLKEEDEDRGEMLLFDSFYNAFMAPYFSCYRCNDTRKALQCLDMDCDGQVDWAEFLVYLKWALHEYPDVKDADELIDVAFRKGLIPAMRDEILRQQETKSTNCVLS